MATENIDIRVSENGSRTVRRSLLDIGSAGREAGGGVAMLQRSLAVLGATVTLGALAKQVLDYNSALAEISTQVDTTVFDMDRISAAALRQAAAFGDAPTTQAAALYDIISAGALSASDAVDTLEASNKLAVAGSTTVAVAADGLTSVLNSYTGQIESAARASDIMFIGVRNGKMRVEDLANSIGRVTPLAAQLSIGFDDLVASIAALTKGGINTAEAVTGVRAILSAVVKPSQEASEMAAGLGLEFNSAGLKAKGFAGFMEDVIAKTGGSTDQLAVLFGGVEAIVPALALSGAAGKDWAATLEQMGTEAGAVQEAFEKMEASPGFQLKRLFASISAEAIKLGSGLMTGLVPVIRFLADNMDAIVVLGMGFAAAFAWSSIVTGVTSVLGPMIALQKALGAASTSQALFTLVTKFATGAMRSFTASLLANPFTALLVVVTLLAAAFVAWGDDIKVTADGAISLKDAFFAALSLISEMFSTVTAAIQVGWETAMSWLNTMFAAWGTSVGEVLQSVWAMAKTVINLYIGGWVSAFNTIKLIWNNFPAFMDVLFVTVANLAAAAAELVLNAWQAPMRAIQLGLSYIDEGAAAGIGTALDAMSIKIPRAKASAAGTQLVKDIGAGITSSMSADYIGGAWGAVLDRATRNKAQEAVAATGPLAGEDPAAGGGSLADAGKKTKSSSSDAETRAGYLARVNRETQNSIDLARSMNFEWARVDEDVVGVQERLKEQDWAKLSEQEELALREKLKAMYDTQDAQDRMKRAYEDFKGPQEQYEKGQQAINAVMAEFPQFAREGQQALRDLRIEYLATKTDLASGLELGRLASQRESENVGGRAASAYTDEYQGANGAMQDLTTRVAALKQLMADDPINSGVYAQRLQEIGLQALQLRANLPGASAMDGLRAGLASYVEDFKGIIPGLTQAWGNFFSSFADGAASAIGQAIVYGDNLGAALKDVAKSALADLLSALIRLGIQWLVMQVIGQTAMAAVGATSSATGVSVAAAWAPAAAAVSLATFGANAGPALAGIATTYGLTTALSAIGAFADGGRIMGRGGPRDDNLLAWVSNGEAVMNAPAVSRYGPLIDAMNAGKLPAFASGGRVGSGSSMPAFSAPATQPAAASSNMKVTIEDHVGARFQVERVSRDEVKIIAKEAAMEAARKESPKAIARELANPSSKVSKSLRSNTTAKTRVD